MRRLVSVLILAGLAPLAAAGVYKWKDADGTTVYSDQPGPGAEELRPAPVTTIPAPRLPAPAPPAAPGAFQGYELVEILNPEHDATLRDNTGNVVVSIALTPNLQSGMGHRLLLLLDGEPYGDGGESTSVTIENLDRGTHVITAVVVDEAGKRIAASDPVTFHLHRTFVRQTPPATPKAP